MYIKTSKLENSEPFCLNTPFCNEHLKSVKIYIFTFREGHTRVKCIMYLLETSSVQHVQNITVDIGFNWTIN